MPNSDIVRVVESLSGKVSKLQETFESRPAPLLTNEEAQWVKLAIRREAQSIEFRKAVISKTLSALLWSSVVAAAGFAWTVMQTYAQNHGWKP